MFSFIIGCIHIYPIVLTSIWAKSGILYTQMIRFSLSYTITSIHLSPHGFHQNLMCDCAVFQHVYTLYINSFLLWYFVRNTWLGLYTCKCISSRMSTIVWMDVFSIWQSWGTSDGLGRCRCPGLGRFRPLSCAKG
jgi:hypothetical protein